MCFLICAKYKLRCGVLWWFKFRKDKRNGIFDWKEHIKYIDFTFEFSLCIDFIIGLQLHKRGPLNKLELEICFKYLMI